MSVPNGVPRVQCGSVAIELDIAIYYATGLASEKSRVNSGQSLNLSLFSKIPDKVNSSPVRYIQEILCLGLQRPEREVPTPYF